MPHGFSLRTGRRAPRPGEGLPRVTPKLSSRRRDGARAHALRSQADVFGPNRCESIRRLPAPAHPRSKNQEDIDKTILAGCLLNGSDQLSLGLGHLWVVLFFLSCVPLSWWSVFVADCILIIVHAATVIGNEA